MLIASKNRQKQISSVRLIILFYLYQNSIDLLTGCIKGPLTYFQKQNYCNNGFYISCEIRILLQVQIEIECFSNAIENIGDQYAKVNWHSYVHFDSDITLK